MADLSMTFKVTGVKETIGNIHGRVDKANQQAAGIVQRYAKRIKSDAKANAPQSPSGIPKGTALGAPAPPSGSLKESITLKSYFNGLGAMVYPEQSKAKYRHFVEMGTKDRFQKNVPTYYMDRKTRTWQVNRSGHVGSYKGKFFMQTAKNRNVGGYKSEMKKIYNVKGSV